MAKIDDILVNGGAVSKLALRQYLAGREVASVHDYGAVGDGIVDDGPAINAALAEAGAVMLPKGTFRIATPVDVPSGASLIGTGYQTALIGDDMSIHVVRVVGGDALVRGLRIVNGHAGLRFWPRDAHNWHNHCEHLVIEDSNIGILLDGFSTGGFRCYWNHFQQIAVLRPRSYGVLLDKSPGGTDDDTPNANHFRGVHVFSYGQSIPGGSGIYIKQGNFMNLFVDCEANVHPDAHSCVRVGDNAQSNSFVNLYTESTGIVDNVYLDPGSSDTRLMSVFHVSAGSAIRDFSGGDFDAFRAGYPDLNTFKRTRIRDAVIERLRYNVEIIETPGTHIIDASKTLYRVSAFTGAVTIELPHPNDYPGVVLTVKKSDVSTNSVTVKGQDVHGIHPEGYPAVLSQQYDFVTVMSFGGGWAILNRGFPNPIGPWVTHSTAFGRDFNADTATTWDCAVAINSLILDLKLRRVLE